MEFTYRTIVLQKYVVIVGDSNCTITNGIIFGIGKIFLYDKVPTITATNPMITGDFAIPLTSVLFAY